VCMRVDPNKHKEHLRVVSPDVVRRKMEFFRLKDVKFEALPIECRSFTIKPPYREYLKFLHPLDPVSLDDLKNWFGTPNELAKTMRSETRCVGPDGRMCSGGSMVVPTGLPTKGKWDFRKLATEERRAVKQMANSLLHGYVAPDTLKSEPVQSVANYMVSAARALKLQIFVAQDLIVCPDEVVEFQGLPALYFNNILIYGNGKIKTKNNTTIHAVQIKRVL
jgi:hypothetical protein